jgi:hypothetical protein
MRPNRLCCVVSAAAVALCVAVSSAETTEAKEVSSLSTAADSATLCVEFVEQPVASCVNTDDEPTRTAITAPRIKKIFRDQKCTLKPRGTPIPSYGCITGASGCYGACKKGVYEEDASVCEPSPGSTCVASPGSVLVLWTHEGICQSDCKCINLRRFREPEPDIITVWRCNI